MTEVLWLGLAIEKYCLLYVRFVKIWWAPLRCKERIRYTRPLLCQSARATKGPTMFDATRYSSRTTYTIDFVRTCLSCCKSYLRIRAVRQSVASCPFAGNMPWCANAHSSRMDSFNQLLAWPLPRDYSKGTLYYGQEKFSRTDYTVVRKKVTTWTWKYETQRRFTFAKISFCFWLEYTILSVNPCELQLKSSRYKASCLM